MRPGALPKADPERNLRLGVIGMSEGNGHPYSWSAIINGYDASVMDSCPFPVIPEYLAQRSFPKDRLPGAAVTHVWTENADQSRHIAAAALIPHIVCSIDEMLNEVDAVLLARDDSERHVEMAVPILEAGLPIYIDKPISNNMRDLDAILSAELFPGQVFSCSALRFSPSLALRPEDWAIIGSLQHIDAVTPKAWATYGVHLIDPILQNCALYTQSAIVEGRRVGGAHVVGAAFPDVSLSMTCLGNCQGPLSFRYFGSHGFVEKHFTDTFITFKEALRQFLLGIRSNTVATTHMELMAMVQILEEGSVL